MRKKKYSHHVGVILSESMYEQLVKITDEREIAISEYIRGLVDENLKSVESKEEKNGKTAKR